MAKDFEKHFFTLPPDKTEPQPATWQVIAPAANTREPLCVYFPEPMDKAMLESGIAVADSSGNLLPGAIEVRELETVWKFTPEKNWSSGACDIFLHYRLEGWAGNNLVRPFDRTIGEAAVEPDHPQTFQLKFHVLPRK